MANKVTSRYKIDEQNVFEYIKNYFIQHSKTYEHKIISTNQEVLDYWTRWNYAG